MSDSMIRQHMIRRLRYLRNWEIVNIFFLPACIYYVLILLNVQDWQPYFLSMLVICLILAQGAFYWHLKLQMVYRKETALPPYFHQTYSLFNKANVALLSIYPVLMIYGRIVQSVNFVPSFWSSALFLFAVLEYVNYYHYQLSHDNWNDIRFLIQHKKIRRSPLWVDLQRTASKPEGML